MTRESTAAHHERFQQAFVAWRWPGPGEPEADPRLLAQVLQHWLAEIPEDAEDVQRLAVGLGAALFASAEHDAARRVAELGLEASLIDAPPSPQRQASTTWLALLGARAAFELGDRSASRVLLERSVEPANGADVRDPLTAYLRVHRDLVGARLAETALELSAAHADFAAAFETARQLAGPGALRDLLAPWADLVFGSMVAGSLPTEATELLELELRTALGHATLGLGRTAGAADAAHRAIAWCVDEGLPADDTVLALHGLLSALPRDEIGAAADRLASAAERVPEPDRCNWRCAVRAMEADALLTLGDVAGAARAVDAARDAGPVDDGVALALALAAVVRERYATGDVESARRALDSLLAVQAVVTGAPAASSSALRLRAACEPAIAAAVHEEAARLAAAHEPDQRRRVAVLIDAVRGLDNPPTVGDGERGGGVAEAGTAPETDRIGRLAAALAGRVDVVVLVVQRVGDATLLLCVGGGTDPAVVTGPPSSTVQQALHDLTAGADAALRRSVRDARPVEAQRAEVGDDELAALGRRAVATLPDAVRDRVLRAHALVVVPDFSAGHDRVPFELLHDGESFFGVGKVVTRCLSLAHALRVVEPALVPPSRGRRALCVVVPDAPGLPELPFVAAELGALRANIGAAWDVEAWEGIDADPRGVLELAPLANVLHVACHGDATAGAEALVLGEGARLTALDVATRHRLGCVTFLNACSLGRGRYVGGGESRGVAYAFARAGAPAVLANLLPVEDESAAELAAEFYEAAQDHTVGEALRRARERMSRRVSAALWSTTVLVGDPFRDLDGGRATVEDRTVRLLGDGPLPPPDRIATALDELRSDPGDLRLAAAIEFARAAGDATLPGLREALRLAREIGHDIGAAHTLLALADVTRAAQAEHGARRDHDVDELAAVLRDAAAALEPLRGVWEPAYQSYQDTVAELRALDPTDEPRELQTFRLSSGLTVNDRSDPAVDALIGLQEAQFEHERFWRGEPTLIVPDLDVASIAHNAAVWGYRHRLFGSGAEAPYAASCARRLAWRGLVPAAATPDVARVVAGLLHFLWGRQYVTHLPGWMLRAHTATLELAIERAGRWASSPAASLSLDVTSVLDHLVPAGGAGSRFSRARLALRADAPGPPDVDGAAAAVRDAVTRCRSADEHASADLAAWILGDVQVRIAAALGGAEPRPDVALALGTMFEDLADHEEDWFLPYLVDGFAGVREDGGTDVVARWSTQVV